MSLPSTSSLMVPCLDDARMPVASCVDALELELMSLMSANRTITAAAAMPMFLPRRCRVRIAISVIKPLRAATGGIVVPSAVGGAVDVVFCGGGMVGIGGSARPKPGGGVGGGGKRLRGAWPASAGGDAVKKGFGAAPFAPGGAEVTPTGGGVGVPAGIGTTGIPGAGAKAREPGGGPSGAREEGIGRPPAMPGRGAPEGGTLAAIGTAGGGGSVDAGLVCAGTQWVVEGGGTEAPGVTSGSAEIGGADVLTDGGGGGMAPHGDEGSGADRGAPEGGGGTDRGVPEGGGGTDRGAPAEGGGGTARVCPEGGGGTEAGRLPGGGGTLRPGGGAEVPGLAMAGGSVALRGRVSDSKISSASTTEGRDAPLLVEAMRAVGMDSEGAPSIHSANSLDSRPCLAASMKLVSLLT